MLEAHGLGGSITFANVNAAQLGWTDALGGFEFLWGHDFRTRIPTHVHGAYVFGVVDSGAVQITVRDRTHLATAGSVIALSPFEPHAEAAVGDRGWSFRYLYLTEASVRHALRAPAPTGETLLQFRTPVIDDDRIAAAIATAHTWLNIGKPLAAVQQQLADLVIAMQRRAMARPAPVRGRARAGVALARQLLTTSTPRRVSLNELADVAGLSAFHFNRVFRAEVGLPPYTFYEQVRVAQAYTLISSGLPLSTVAYQLGYADQAHFTRHFHRASFLTPGQYAALVRRAKPLR